ncbi:MAG: hypothetical protein AAB353_11015, partial [Candidatus Hydrogenedentota bacterium]
MTTAGLAFAHTGTISGIIRSIPLRMSLPALMCMVLFAPLSQAATVGSRFDPDDFTSLGTLNISSGAITFNTTTLTVTGFANGVTSATQGGITTAVFCFTDVSITGTATVTVTGTRPIAILSKGSITLGTPIAVSGGAATLSTAGVGIVSGSNGGAINANGIGTGFGGAATNEGGSGAGYGGLGGQGASANTTGRATYGANTLYDLFGGSGGGGGGANNAAFSGAGGAGGGGIELSANITITIQATGSITAN